jgi:protease-4
MAEVETPPVRRSKWRRRLFLLALILAGAYWLLREQAVPSIPEGSYVHVDLQGDYPEMPPDGVLERVVGRRALSMIDLVNLLRDAGEDGRVAGVLVRVRQLGVGWAKANEIRDALLSVRAAEKPVIAFLEHELVGGLREYFVASAASQIYLPPGATTPLSGLMAQYTFFGGMWEKLDIDPQVQKIREYKTVGDQIAGKDMSSHHREMANALLDSIYEHAVSGIAQARGLTPQVVRAIIDRCPITAAELVAEKLADGQRFFEQLRAELVGPDGKLVKARDYRRTGGPKRQLGEGKLAVIYATGPIVTGESTSGVREGIVGADTIVEAFRKAREDKSVKAIIVRVDSPGGSALASDIIWQAALEARAEKPVVVSMSDVAASGGYYIAAAATRILAQPGTLTGSIGVVTWKPNVAGFLHNLGINTESLTRGKLARLPSLTSSFSDAERQRVADAMNHIYDLFLQRVAAGRSFSAEDVNRVGRGRVWTGEQAEAIGLVDELGGFGDAVAAAKTLAGLPVEERFELVFYPKPKGIVERLADLMQMRLDSTAPAWWQHVRALLPLYDFPEGSLLTLMPERIEIK